MIAQMRVLAILHTSVCIPTLWFFGHCQELKDSDFGVFYMGHSVAFERIALNGSPDEEFLMNIFDPIVTELDNFVSYIQCIFE